MLVDESSDYISACSFIDIVLPLCFSLCLVILTFSAMDRWYWTESSLMSGEVSKHSVPCKRLYDGDSRTGYEDGHLTLTNVRVLWKHSSQNKSLALSLSVISRVQEESAGFISSAKLVFQLSPKPPDQPSGPISHSPHDHIKLAVKQSDLENTSVQVQMAISDRAWESRSFKDSSLRSSDASSGRKMPRAGILGIERAIEARQKATDASISGAFEDLKQLITQAKEMVALSHNIAERIKDQGHESSSDETTQFRSCLLSLGIDDPVTRDAVGSTNEYHKKLAGEICQALQTPIQEAGGVMLLSEVFCRINRARGLELVSPEDVANACSLMKGTAYPLQLYAFPTGVQVLQLATMNSTKLIEKIRDVLTEECVGAGEGSYKGMSAGEVARTLGLPLLLAKERLLFCELQGAVLRDESSQGLIFFPNLFDQVEV